MSSIELNNACIDIPIYDTNGRSLKKHIYSMAMGAQTLQSNQGYTIVKALQNINLILNKGDRIGLIGHNGAGKSTLLRLLSKIYHPTSGTCKIEGSIGSLMNISLGIDLEATGRENIYIRATLLGYSKAEINNHIDEIIEFSELHNFIDLPLRTYSSGMKLRLAFAISTTIRPQILLMDEWLSVGDNNFSKKAHMRISKVIDSTNILVIASHSQDLLTNICNRMLWLERGKIIMDASPDEVLPKYYDSNEA